MRVFLFFVVFLDLFLFSDVSVECMSIVSLVGGSRATPHPSGVITAVTGATFGVGGGSLSAGAVGAKDSLVCFLPGGLGVSPLATLDCLVFILPRGEASLPAVLVGFFFNFAVRLVNVTLIASVRYGA